MSISFNVISGTDDLFREETMRNRLTSPLSAVFVIFLVSPCTVMAAELLPSAGSPQSSELAASAPTGLPSNQEPASDPDAVWVDGRWMWDNETGELVWCPGYMNLPIVWDAYPDGNQCYRMWPDCSFLNISFGPNFVISGGSAAVAPGGPAPVNKALAPGVAHRDTRSIPPARAGRITKARAVRHPWYRPASPMHFFSNIGVRTGQSRDPSWTI